MYTHYLGQHFNLSSGLSFNQFGEKIDYNLYHQFIIDTSFTFISDSARILSWDSINHIVYVTYDTYSVDTTITDSTLLKTQLNNKHSYLTLPLLIGYDFTFKKWNFNLQTGIGLSILMRSKAKYINYELSNFIETPPKKVLFNYFISPTIGYQVTDRFQMNFNPQLVINTQNSINYKDSKQYYSNWGISFGICYSLTTP